MTRIHLLLVAALLAVAGGVTLGAPLTAAGGLNACPASNPPNMLAILSGSSQTAQLGKAFQQNLQVALANSNGCPLTGSLAGISVDFVAPSSGASGTFASSASNVAVVGTDANGVAIAPPFTANSSAGAYSVHAQSDYGTVKLYLTNTARGVAKTVTPTGQAEQSAAVLSRYAEPLRATVLDADGKPVQGTSVAFSLGTGIFGAGANFAGGGAQATAITDSAGQATSPPLIANGVAGLFAATASVEGLSEPVSYSLRNLATRTTIATKNRTTQTATVAQSYRRPLQARVLDGDGRPVEGATVTFSLGSSAAGSNAAGAGATFAGGGTQATALTGASGVATSPRFRAGTAAGRFTATATTTGVTEPVTFSLRNVAGKPAAIAAGVAASASTPVGSRFAIRLAVTVTDANNNPVRGVRVTFTAPSRGPGGHFGTGGTRTARVTTNVAGIASAPTFTAGRVPGGYVVTASVRGAKRAAAFALVNERP
jgi:protocatechuate 3,4-dioxygenase beta subunit